MTLRSVIIGTGHYVPQRRVTNAELAEQIGGDAAWIEQRTGIQARHIAASDEGSAALGEQAARRALADAGCAPQDLDALIVATLSPDLMFPGSGVLVQARLGLPGLPALDVRNQCSGYLYALSIADAWLRAGVYKRVLVIGSEVHSSGLDYSPDGRAITALFGDGAGAVVLEAREVDADTIDAPGVLAVRLGADGTGAEQLWCEAPGSLLKPHLDAQVIAQKRHFPRMNGRAVFRHAIQTLERELKALLKAHDLDAPEARSALWLVPHQANRHINEHVAQALGLDPARVIHTIEGFGNTTAASIPMALDVARGKGLVGSGSLLLHAAFGSGFTWGTALVRL